MTSRRPHEILIALLALAVLLPSAAAAEPVGFVAAVRGFAELGASEGDLAIAAIDRDVSAGDVVRTGAGGWLKMLLADDTLLAVDGRSELRLDRFGGSAGTHVTLLAGHVRAKLAGDAGAPMEMTTPQASIVARGTEWLTWLDADTTWVCAVTGSLDVKAAGTSLEVAAGECAQADSRLRKASRPRSLRAVAMRPSDLKPDAALPAKAAAEDADEIDPATIHMGDLLRTPAAEDRAEGTPPASAAIP